VTKQEIGSTGPGEFVNVFDGYDPTVPYLLRDWLEQNDVVSEVRGFDMMAALGDIPGNLGYPTVWVPPEDAARAHKLIAEFERPKPPVASWTCSTCDEENPGEFASCWNCGCDGPNLPNHPEDSTAGEAPCEE
jgi:hypothetical protein